VGDQNACKIVEIYIDLNAVPEKYSVFHIIDTIENWAEERKEGQMASGETELRQYIKEAVALVGKQPSQQDLSEGYKVEEDPFYVGEAVKLFKGVSRNYNCDPVIVKQHELYVLQDKNIAQEKLAKAINTAIVQTRVKHPNICRVLEMHLDISRAPKQYSLNHILEAMNRDVEMEIAQRSQQQRPLSDLELWDFLRQTASALVYAHAKVLYT